MGLFGFNLRRKKAVVEKYGEEVADKLAEYGIDALDKVERYEEVLHVQGFGEKEIKKVEKILSASKTDNQPESTTETDERKQNLSEVPDGVNFPWHKGAGYYILSNGDEVRGKQKATAGQQKINEA